jgi:hypothetical protein
MGEIGLVSGLGKDGKPQIEASTSADGSTNFSTPTGK